mmetsp:Transcript_5894/g.16828  ORF Transcript_5894/g.16828 Transcript_5894/m.16828 type:complete len:1074 (-) Transcript_5894:415-3636(-)
MAEVLTSSGFLALLDEPEQALRLYALQMLNQVVHQFWFEIAGSLAAVEAQYEDETFEHQNLAALVASKVYFNLGELDDALSYALSAGSLFDVSERSEYVQSILARAIDQYIEKRVEAPEAQGEAPAPIDERLTALVERMFDRCFEDGQLEQAIGIALESRRLDKLEEAVSRAPDQGATLDFALAVCQRLVISRTFRREVLRLLVALYGRAPQPSWVNISQGLMFLDCPRDVAAVLDQLLRGSEDDKLLAYQIGFDLFENEMQSFTLQVGEELATLAPAEPKAPAPAEAEASAPDAAAGDDAGNRDGADNGNGAGEEAGEETGEGTPLLSDEQPQQPAQPIAPVPELSEEDKSYLAAYKRLREIIDGSLPIALHLDFLYSRNHADLQILKNMKNSVEARHAVCHSAIIFANAVMHKGTTVDAFLRENLEWLGRATNWAKFSATAGLGVIHSGHLAQGRALMAPYLPRDGGGGSPYSEGGALYALGLIHANHGSDIREFLLESLRATQSEVTQHGACLGLGVAGLGTQDEEVFEDLKNVLYTDSAVAGEAAGISMGLLFVGTATEKGEEMLAYAHDTQHEKIIRGLSMGLALTMYAREEGAETLIEQMTRDQDPIIRYGGMFVIALAYRGTGNNGAVQRLLHFAVSDVSDDVRRGAVMCLGFLLIDSPAQCPRLVALLAESYNPHVRYGAAMAVGIACGATGLREATELLQPLLSDPIDYVRQGALLAMAMVLVQQPTARTAPFRERLAKVAANKHEETMGRMGAMMATGILDAGGRNATMALRSRSGYFRRTAIVGLALFTQYWYWYPLSYLGSLAFQPSALIGLTPDLQVPKFELTCNIRPSVFAYPPSVAKEETKTKEKIKKAELSTTARARQKAKEKKAEKAKGEGSADGASAMDTDEAKPAAAATADAAPGGGDTAMADAAPPAAAANAAATEGGDSAKAADGEGDGGKPAPEPEPSSYTIQNPARVVPAQEKFLAAVETERWRPIQAGFKSGFIVLKDLTPGEPVELVSASGPAEGAAPAGNGPAPAAEAPPATAAQPAVAAPATAPADDDDDDDEPAPPAPFDYSRSS